MVFNFDVRAIWRSGLPLFYVTILATLCIKGLRSSSTSYRRIPRDFVAQIDREKKSP